MARGELARLLAAHPLRREPALYWKAWRVTAGRAEFGGAEFARPDGGGWRIGLSSRVLDDEEKTLRTLRHEYAHLLAVERHGRAGAGHGTPWRAAMRELGEAPERTHDYPVERNASRVRAVYRCRRCGAEIARGRRLPRGRRYAHVPCGGLLQFVRITGADADGNRA